MAGALTNVKAPSVPVTCHRYFGGLGDRLDQRRRVSLMRHYEMMIILDPTVEERTLNNTLDKLLHVIPADGGTIDHIDVWGSRKMTFPINKKTDGLYAVIDFSATSETAAELDRQLGLNEQVLRTKVMRKDDAYSARTAA
jgi:small subunit ribosomal protein S6